MNKRKAVFIVLILACMLPLLISCSDEINNYAEPTIQDSSDGTNNHVESTTQDSSYDKNNRVELSIKDNYGNVIYFGMERSGVENILGEPPNNPGVAMATYRMGGDVLSILYRDSRVVLILVSGQDVGWNFYDNVDGGVTTRIQLHELYTPYLVADGASSYKLFLDNERTPMDVGDVDPRYQRAYDFDNDYIVDFFIFADDIVHGFFIADRLAWTEHR